MYVNDLIKTKEENLPVEIRDANEKKRKDNRKAVKKYTQGVDYIKIRLDNSEIVKGVTKKEYFKNKAEEYEVSLNQFMILSSDLLLISLNEEIPIKTREEISKKIEVKLSRIQRCHKICESDYFKLDDIKRAEYREAEIEIGEWKNEIKEILNYLNNLI